MVFLAGLIRSGFTGAGLFISDTSVPDTEISASASGDSSSTATIRITMYAVDDKSEPHADTATVTLRARTAAGD